MTDRLSFEHFIRRWAWSPSKGVRRRLRPTPQEIRDIERSFKSDQGLVTLYINEVTDTENAEAMWCTGAPIDYPAAVGLVIVTPLILHQYASAVDAVAWGKLIYAYRDEDRGRAAFQRQARELIAHGVPVEFAQSLRKGGVTKTEEIADLWDSGIPAEYLLAARSAL